MLRAPFPWLRKKKDLNKLFEKVQQLKNMYLSKNQFLNQLSRWKDWLFTSLQNIPELTLSVSSAHTQALTVLLSGSLSLRKTMVSQKSGLSEATH